MGFLRTVRDFAWAEVWLAIMLGVLWIVLSALSKRGGVVGQVGSTVKTFAQGE